MYKNKYIKYKNKYLGLQLQKGGVPGVLETFAGLAFYRWLETNVFTQENIDSGIEKAKSIISNPDNIESIKKKIINLHDNSNIHLKSSFEEFINSLFKAIENPTPENLQNVYTNRNKYFSDRSYYHGIPLFEDNIRRLIEQIEEPSKYVHLTTDKIHDIGSLPIRPLDGKFDPRSLRDSHPRGSQPILPREDSNYFQHRENKHGQLELLREETLDSQPNFYHDKHNSFPEIPPEYSGLGASHQHPGIYANNYPNHSLARHKLSMRPGHPPVTPRSNPPVTPRRNHPVMPRSNHPVTPRRNLPVTPQWHSTSKEEIVHSV
jgi:hypothetical protein